MTGQQGSRLRKVAMTGVLTPGLVLGAAGAFGFGLYPGHLATPVEAESILSGGVCSQFQDPNLAAAKDMSVADVAEKANPAVVTILNLQPMSQATMGDIGGIQGIPGLPEIPGFPGGDQIPNGDVPGASQLPSDQLPADNGSDASSNDTLVPVGSGSGFIVDDTGHVVTNAHVIDGASELKASLADGTEVPLTLVGRDDLLDVAVVKLELPAGTDVPGVLNFGNSDALRAGDDVVAIGNALGSFPNTVSEGTVNAVNRAFPDESGLTTMIQHDAEIWHGNSGGPLLDLKGDVVGVNTAGIGSSAMGTEDTGAADMAFAVEGNTVCKAAAELIANGEIVWPYLGIQGESSSDGQQVVEVVEDGPSAKAGLEVGDVITAFDGQAIDNQHSLLDMLFARAPGDTVGITVDRDGVTKDFQVTLGERPEVTD